MGDFRCDVTESHYGGPHSLGHDHCDEFILMEPNVSPKAPKRLRERTGQQAPKPLSLRYAEVLKLRQAIQRALSESRSQDLERRASK